ncbi:MAG: phosphatase PAP2 family protein [Pseudomonadota bacterium]|nr:phosphatase PAP2 family protein [Pseudomonadota bacterium]
MRNGLAARVTKQGRRETFFHAAARRSILLIGALIFWPGGSFADSFTLSEALEDTRLYFTAPVRWDSQDWMFFGGTLLAIGASHEFDGRVRTHFATANDALLNGKDRNSVRDALPAVALILGTGLSASFIDDSDGYRETWSLLEAGVFSTVTGEVLSLAGGRERPDATSSPNQWRHGGDSFPSVHTSAAFAIGMVFAESGNDEYRWIRRIIGYGVAAGTGYIRVRENVHWLSDTVAGSALGIATARFVLNRGGNAQQESLQFQPTKDGWQFAYSIRTH